MSFSELFLESRKSFKSECWKIFEDPQGIFDFETMSEIVGIFMRFNCLETYGRRARATLERYEGHVRHGDKNRNSERGYPEKGGKIFLKRSFTGASSFYNRAASLAAGTKCQAQPSGPRHTCLFIHLLSTIPHWKDRFIGAWGNCSRSRLREFCTNRRIMPQAQAHGRKHNTRALTIACGSIEAFSRGVWRVRPLCNRISQPLIRSG